MQAQLAKRAATFLQALKDEWQVDDVTSTTDAANQAAVELPRIAVQDPAALRPAEIEALRTGFMSRHATVALECNRTTLHNGIHPLVRIGEQLAAHIPARWPITNPSDGPDGTVKIHDTGTPQDSRSLTSMGMAAHQDGWLSLRGVLSVTGLWADSHAAEPAATYSANIVRLALDLRAQDPDAFLSLFADDAVVIHRTHDDSIVATSPVLYTKNGWTYSFFREPNDEYNVSSGSSDSRAAVKYLSEHVSFCAPGSAYTYLDRPGRALFLNNRHCVHGRTPFADDISVGRKRVIASKWWICDPSYRSLVWD